MHSVLQCCGFKNCTLHCNVISVKTVLFRRLWRTFLSVMFMSGIFMSCNFMSCNFMSCKLVRHFHVLLFHALHIGPSISCPAISCPAIWMVRHFHVQHFQSTRLNYLYILQQVSEQYSYTLFLKIKWTGSREVPQEEDFATFISLLPPLTRKLRCSWTTVPSAE